MTLKGLVLEHLLALGGAGVNWNCFFFFTRQESWAWFQQGFLQPSFCRNCRFMKHLLWWGNIGWAILPCWLEERENLDKSIFPSFSKLSLSSIQARHISPTPSSPIATKASEIYCFCRNWAVRWDQARLSIYLSIYKQVGFNDAWTTTKSSVSLSESKKIWIYKRNMEKAISAELFELNLKVQFCNSVFVWLI